MKQFKLILRRSKVLRTRPPLLPSKNKIKQPGLSPSNQRHLSWTPWQRVLSTALSNSLSGPLENQVSNNNDMLHTKLNKRNKWLIWSTFNPPTRPITIERHMQLSFPKQKQKATSKWNIIIIKKNCSYIMCHTSVEITISNHLWWTRSILWQDIQSIPIYSHE